MNPISKEYLNKSEEAFKASLHNIPKKTGKLRHTATKHKQSSDSVNIYIDLNISPYADYINRPGYRTQGYWDRFLDDYLNNLIRLTKARKK